MALAGHRCKKPYEILTTEEVERIYQAALDVLAETGMTVAHPQALAMLEDAGCEVDRPTERV